DADIAKCFDRIDHGVLLEKLDAFPAIRRQVRGSLGTHDKSQVVEEPCEVKVSRTVLKTSRVGDCPA
ncbi:MAG: hypothetical protein ACP5D4_07705, partial [Baaleninema sp.]